MIDGRLVVWVEIRVDKSSNFKMLVFGVVWLQQNSLLFRDHYLLRQFWTLKIFTLKCDKNNDDEDMDVLQTVGVTLYNISFDHNLIVMKMMPIFCKQSIQNVLYLLDEIIIARNFKIWSKQWWRRIWMCCKMLDKSCPTNHPTSRLFLADDSRCINWSLDSNIKRNSHSTENT